MFNMAIIETTNQCNSQCCYCYNMQRHEQPIFLAVPDIIHFLHFISSDVHDIILSGGEFLLHPQWLELILEMHKRNFNTNIITNGFLLRNLFELPIKIKSITISLDSLNRKWNYLRSTKNICLKNDIIALKQKNIADVLFLQVILNKVSAAQENLIDLFSFCQENEIGLKFKLMDDYRCNKTEKYLLSRSEISDLRSKLAALVLESKTHFFVELPPKEDNIFCHCAILDGNPNLRIRSDGQVFVCEKADDPSFLLGNIIDIDKSYKRRFAEIRGALLARIVRMSKTVCADCTRNSMCGKGCAILMKERYGTEYHCGRKGALPL